MTTDSLDGVERLVRDVAGPAAGTPVLVVDSPGLSASALAQGRPVAAFCDDARGHQSLPDGVDRVQPGDVTRVDEVWLRLPKPLDALDEVVGWAIRSGAQRVVLGARIKDLTRAATTVLRRHVHDVTASLGRDKARVLVGMNPIDHPVDWRPGWPRTRQASVPGLRALALSAHGGTFGGNRLDAGTDLLLRHLPWGDQPDAARVLDWGTGNGVIAVSAAIRLPGALVRSIDVSWAGAAAARETAALAGCRIDVEWCDGGDWLDQAPDSSLDLIVTNPPFHQGVARDSSATRAMLLTAPRVLARGGQLICVHNSHLPWPQVLTGSGLGSVRRLAQDRQFTVTQFRRH